MASNRNILKSFFETGKRPNEAQFAEQIDSFIHKEEDKASISDAENGNDNQKFMTSAATVASVRKFSPVRSVNGQLGAVVIPPVTSVSGNAGTATALLNPRTINGVSFNGTSNITLPEDSTAWQNAVFQAQSPVLKNTSGYAGVRYRKKNGIVFLDGVISGGTSQTNGTSYLLFSLPPGLIPERKLVFLTLAVNDNSLCRIDIEASGKVYGVKYSNLGTSLNGISFAI